jgi:hypothetical protein
MWLFQVNYTLINTWFIESIIRMLTSWKCMSSVLKKTTRKSIDISLLELYRT